MATRATKIRALKVLAAAALAVLAVVAVLAVPAAGRRSLAQTSEDSRAGNAAVQTAGNAAEGATASASSGEATNDGAATVEGEHPESYLDFAVAGGPLMIPLGVSSLLWLTFLVERVFALRRARVLPGPLVRAIEALPAGAVAPEQVETICRAHDSNAARVLRVASTHLDLPREEIEHAVDNAAQREIHAMRRYLRLFAIIAAVAPLLGLLGTVTGMIQAFREVALQGLGSGKALAPGIYKALVTTAAGLLIAIPALLTHYWFLSRIDNYVHDIDRLVVDFVEARRRGRSIVTGAESPTATTSRA